MGKKCLKCGYERKKEDSAPGYECPNCGAIYAKVEAVQKKATSESKSAVYTMKGRQDLLEVFEDRITITPKGVMGFLNKGIKGTQEIPYTSIVAVQFKEAGALFSGYLQFTIPRGNESRGGIFAAMKNENTFIFAHAKNNAMAREIEEYIDGAIYKLRALQATAPGTNRSDELQKLIQLREQDVLSEKEFQDLKKRLVAEIKKKEQQDLMACRQKGCGIGCLIIIATFLVFCFIGSFSSQDIPRSHEVVKNSEWDASVSQVKKWLKANLKDPGSLEFIEWSPVSKRDGGGFMVRVKYRAKNSFGGYVVNNKVFFLNSAGTVKNQVNFFD